MGPCAHFDWSKVRGLSANKAYKKRVFLFFATVRVYLTFLSEIA